MEKKTFRDLLKEIEKRNPELWDATEYILAIEPESGSGVRSCSGTAMNIASEFAMIITEIAKQYPYHIRREVIDLFDYAVKLAMDEILKPNVDGFEEMIMKSVETIIESIRKR